jgi:peroxiredoxin
MELEALQEALPAIKSAGAAFVAISPQQYGFNREFIEQKKFTFDLLSDLGNQTAKAYGLVYTLPEDLRKIYLQFGIDVPKHNGDDSWTLPLPARYIIDRKGIVRYAEVSVDYTVRPEPEHTIAALRELQS